MSLPTQPLALLSTPKSGGPVPTSSTPSQVHQHSDPSQIYNIRNFQGSGSRIVTRLNSEEDGQTSNDSATTPDPWLVTDEQRKYYTNQFAQMQPNLDGKIDGIFPFQFSFYYYHFILLAFFWYFLLPVIPSRAKLEDFVSSDPAPYLQPRQKNSFH